MTDMTPADYLRAAMDKRGLTDPVARAALAAIVNGECGFKPKYELGYAHTSNYRIRQFFSSRVSHLSDAELDAVKADDYQWFELIYGAGNSIGRMLGNAEPGDGYKYRGCGMIQLTGKSNFVRYGKLSGHPEIVAHPELANRPDIAADIAVAYILDRYKGGGWDGYKRAVGNSMGGPDAVKNASFSRYLASGEFAYRGTVVTPKHELTLSMMTRSQVIDFQKEAFPNEPREWDGIVGPKTRAAWAVAHP